MSYYQGRDRRKPSGGKLKHVREKRKRELGSRPIETVLKENEERQKERAFGGGVKIKLKQALYANVVDPRTHVTRKAKISSVKTNPASVDYSRRRILTAGATIVTELGEAVVTSRPGQHGTVDAVLKTEK